MQVEQQDIRDFRIYAAATNSDRGGYTASVVVKHSAENGDEPETVFSDLWVGDGHRFEDPEAGIAFAFEVGRRVVRRHQVAEA